MKKHLTYGLLCLSLSLPLNAMAFDFGGGSNSDDNNNNNDRLERLERSLNTLEREVYRNPSTSGSSSRKPYEKEVEVSSDNIEIRLSQIERKLREITGAIEESNFNRRKLAARLEKFINEINWKLSQVEKASGVDANSNFTPMEVPADNDSKAVSGDGSQILGSIPVDSIEEQNNVGPKYEYDQAFSQLRQAKYSVAAEGFHNFIQKYPKHTLVSNAYYWLGETFYVQKDYEQASVAFLQGYQTEPKGNKAPDNLLKLAISLNALDKKRESCATFEKLSKEFPNVSPTIRRHAEKEREHVGCN